MESNSSKKPGIRAFPAQMGVTNEDIKPKKPPYDPSLPATVTLPPALVDHLRLLMEKHKGVQGAAGELYRFLEIINNAIPHA